MNRNCVFTICAKNYIGLAQALEKSINRYNNNIDFYIVVADEFDRKVLSVADNILIAKYTLNIDNQLWINMTFKYNLTEFCTCIKPFSIEYFFEKGYDTVCYLDPDTYFFNDLGYVYEKLEKFLVVTAPHITIPDYPYTGDLPDRSFLFNGISNLGFGAFRNHPKTINIIKWWEDRLSKLCFGEMLWAVCTDQKWTDFFPAFFNYDEILFSNNLGLNLAPWNYFERKVIKDKDGYFIVSRTGANQRKDKLIFCHFAGYNYREMATEGIVNNQNRMRISNLRDYKDIEPLVDEYVNYIHENRDLFNSYLDLSYTYNYFNDGCRIEKLHRRLYNGIVTNFNYKGNPFDTGKGSFYELLKKKGLLPLHDKKKPVDSIDEKNMHGFERKLSILYKVLRTFFKIFGYRNYVLFLQFIRRLSLYDLNTFLLGKEYENYKLR